MYPIIMEMLFNIVGTANVGCDLYRNSSFFNNNCLVKVFIHNSTAAPSHAECCSYPRCKQLTVKLHLNRTFVYVQTKAVVGCDEYKQKRCSLRTALSHGR